VGESFRVYGRIGNFTQVPNSVMNDGRLSIGARFLYVLLLGYRWGKDFCFPGQETVAGKMGVSDRQVRRWLDELEAAAIIKRKRRGLGKTDLVFFKPLGLEDMPRKRRIHADRTLVSTLDRTPMSDKEYSEGEEDEDRTAQGSVRPPSLLERSEKSKEGGLKKEGEEEVGGNGAEIPTLPSPSVDGAIDCGNPVGTDFTPDAPGCPVADLGAEEPVRGAKAQGQGQDGGGAVVNGGSSILRRVLAKSAADRAGEEKSRSEVTRKASGEISELYREYRLAFKIKFKVDDSVLPKWLGKERSLVKKLIEMYGFALTKSAMLLYINQWDGFARGREGMPDIGWLWVIRDTVFTAVQSGNVPKVRIDNRTFDQYHPPDGGKTEVRKVMEKWVKQHEEKPNSRV
jgi:hypothetical protein